MALTVLVIAFRHEPRRKHRSSIVACVFIAMGTCLPSRCLETVAVIRLISRSLHSNGCTRYNIVMCWSDCRRGLDWLSDLLDSLIQLVTTLDSSLLHTHTHTHTLVYVVTSSLAVAWYRLSTTDVPLPLGSRTIPGLRYQLVTAAAHNDWNSAVL
jgi:hypothetical protein